jgi:phosphotransferase system HPr-like phosphotransfer protein
LLSIWLLLVVVVVGADQEQAVEALVDYLQALLASHLAHRIL